MARVDVDDLKSLDSIDKLASFFSQRLNYEYVGTPISTRRWKQGIADPIVKNDIRLLAKHKDFHIIYSRLNRLMVGQQRPIINHLLKEHPYLLVIFSDTNCDNWHFVNIKYDDEAKNRRLFRRIVMGPDERLHTAAQRINMLEVVDEKVSPLELQTLHDKAFDVEEVTEEFYERYTEIFRILSADIGEENPKEDINKEAQVILNRLLFLYFIQKKGWLNNNKRYLYESFLEYWDKDPKGNSFYSNFLVRVFEALSSRENPYREALGDVPCLNGGLFEVDPSHSKMPFRLVIRNETFYKSFDGLLEKFNFTVREDTPLDVEVAIDPEMLGKIFENLVLKWEKSEDLRKKTGSYYTPRAIVHFMCRESLKAYLTRESEIGSSKVDRLFAMNPAAQLTGEELKELQNVISLAQARLLRNLARRAYILDPAVGSGAFLVGMLHDMVSIIKLLDTREFGQNYIQKPNYDYELKRQLIETSLYGVDIQDQAVRICELRLWLSLIVDYQKQENEDVPPLPNLSYKICCGDSLIETLFGQNVELNQLVRTDKGRQLIDGIRKGKEAYFLETNVQEKNRIELGTLVKQCELTALLIEEKSKSFGIPQLLPSFQETTEERKEREALEQTKREYDRILLSATKKRKKVEAMVKGKISVAAEDIHDLKKKVGISFIWKLDFAEVFKEKGGFDIIITNPPYLKERDNKEVFRKVMNSDFGKKHHQGKMDYWFYFLHKGIDVSKKGTIICFISSRYWLNSTGSKKLIQRIQNELSFLIFLDIGKLKVFDDVAGQHMVAVYARDKNIDNFVYKKLENNLDDIGESRGTDNLKLEILCNRSVFSENLEIVLDSRNLNISNVVNLGTVCDISQGVVEAPDKLTKKQLRKSRRIDLQPGTGVFVLSKDELAHLNLTSKEKDIIRKYLDPTDVFKYGIKPGSMKYLIYTDKTVRKQISTDKKFINLKTHLDNLKKFITSSNGPYGLHRPRNIKYFIEPKIVSKNMFVDNDFAYDEDGYFAGFSFSLLIQRDNNFDLKYILSILNSKLALFWFYRNGKRRGAGVDIGVGKLRSFPIKDIPLSSQRALISIVNKILYITKDIDYLQNASKRAEVNKLEDQIDSKVYELYGLTGEEIAFIEERHDNVLGEDGKCLTR